MVHIRYLGVGTVEGEIVSKVTGVRYYRIVLNFGDTRMVSYKRIDDPALTWLKK